MEKLNKETIKRISNSPGIYYIKNIVNGKEYIGKSSKLRRRLYDHYKKRSDKNKVLYKAFDKYGIENFEFTILLYVEENIETLNTVLSELETYYIQEFNTFKYGYNLTLGGDGISGKVYSEEECAKLLLYKPSTIKKARTNHSVLKGFLLESCCIYNIIKTFGIDSITGIWKDFKKDG